MKLQQRHSQIQKQHLTQKMILSPRLIQRMQHFQHPYDQLLDAVQQEVNDNVMLEVLRFDQLSSRSASSKGSGDKEGWLHNVAGGERLHDVLLNQLDLAYLPHKDRRVAERLIDALDHRGYLNDYAGVRDHIVSDLGVAPRKVFDVLKVIHTFEPDGVGARSLKECLLIQLDQHQFGDPALYELLKRVISHHMQDLDKPNATLAKKLSLQDEAIEAIRSFIRDNLTPNPGANYQPDNFNRHISPSFDAYVTHGQLHLTHLEATQGIQIGVSKQGAASLNDPSMDNASKAYLQEQLNKARQWVDTLQRRQDLMERMVRYIAERQIDFIEKGPFYLEPLLQREVCDALEMPPSTVSRILSNKYLQTPHGLYALKELCPRDHFGKTAIRLEGLIQHMIEQHPTYSDQDIAIELNAQGMGIARRTVTKYRLRAGIEGKFQREADPLDASP